MSSGQRKMPSGADGTSNPESISINIAASPIRMRDTFHAGRLRPPLQNAAFITAAAARIRLTLGMSPDILVAQVISKLKIDEFDSVEYAEEDEAIAARAINRPANPPRLPGAREPRHWMSLCEFHQE